MKKASKIVAAAIGVLLGAPAIGVGQFTGAGPAPTGAAGAAAAIASAAAKAEQDVLKAERERFVAMVKADAGALDKLLAAELSYTHSNAQVQDKAGFIGDIKSGAIKYLSIEPTDMHAQVFENAAVVTGGAAVHVIQNGSDLSIKIRYTNTQVNRKGMWQMVAWQATRLPQ